jgi:hypothetical protein
MSGIHRRAELIRAGIRLTASVATVSSSQPFVKGPSGGRTRVWPRSAQRVGGEHQPGEVDPVQQRRER